MLKVELIGHLGADAEVVSLDNAKFAKCRVADSQRWKDTTGVVHESTQWIDVTIRDYEKVLPYLKKGSQIFVRGNLDTRVYSSAKDKCQKCGLTVRSMELQLLSAGKKVEQENQVNNGQSYDVF